MKNEEFSDNPRLNSPVTIEDFFQKNYLNKHSKHCSKISKKKESIEVKITGKESNPQIKMLIEEIHYLILWKFMNEISGFIIESKDFIIIFILISVKLFSNNEFQKIL
jgi:hypothetical protein